MIDTNLQKVFDNWIWYVDYINEINNNNYSNGFSNYYWGDTKVYIEDSKIVIDCNGDIYLFPIL